MTGTFVTIDGPGGVGKSTVTTAVVDQLREADVPVFQTREPSDTPLGHLVRSGTEQYRGIAMACLVAADRYMHLVEEIRPAIARGDTIVCDRHVASSLVLQVLDGVSRDTVWELNRHGDMPDLAVILNGRSDVIAKRLTSRGAHSRYERQAGSSERECAAFREAARFLMAAGIRVVQLDASVDSPDVVARAVVAAIKDSSMKGRP